MSLKGIFYMKKTLIALAVAATAATSANAFVVYEQDGSKVELSGSFRMFLGRNPDANNGRGDLTNDGSRLIVKATHDLGNGLSALAGYQIRFEDSDGNGDAFKQAGSPSPIPPSNFGSPTTRELFGGFKLADVGSLTFGRQSTSADEVLQDMTYWRTGWYNQITKYADKGVKFRSAEWNGFSFGADYVFGHSNKDIDTYVSTGYKYKSGYALTAFYNTKVGEHKFEFAAGYTHDNYDGKFDSAVEGYTQESASNTAKRRDIWLVHGDYTYGPFYLALNYGQIREKYDNLDWANPPKVWGQTDNGPRKGHYALVDFRYQFTDIVGLFGQWEYLNYKYDNVDLFNAYDKSQKNKMQNRYQMGVDYRLGRSAVVYVMYEHERNKKLNDETDKEHIFGTGLRVYF